MFNRKQLIAVILRNLVKAALAVAVASVAVIFLSSKISKISDSLAEQRTSAFVLEKRNETVSQLKNDFKIIGEADKRIDDAFPPTENMEGFIAVLESLALQNSLQQSLSFGGPQENSIDYGINLNGNVFTIANYLKGFENLPYFTAISGITVNSSSAGWETDSTISIRAKVYTR